jgi:hypothetical protein
LIPGGAEQAVRAVTDLARLDAALASPSLEELRRASGL